MKKGKTMNNDLRDAILTGTAAAIAARAWDTAGTTQGTIRQHNDALVVLARAIVAAREPEDCQRRWVSVRDDGDIRPMTLAKSRDACEMLCSLGGVPVESIQQVRITKERKDV